MWLTREPVKFQIFTMEDNEVIEDKLINFIGKNKFLERIQPLFNFSLGPNCLLLFDFDNSNL